MGRHSLRNHKKRRVQFSLRALFVVITVTCVWLGIYMRKVREQAAAVAAIRAVGGIVTYDFESPQRSSPVRQRPGAYGWWPLADLSNDYLFDVVSVDLQFASLSGRRQADEALQQLQALPKLRELTLHKSQSGNNAMCAAGRLTNLNALWMPDAAQVKQGAIGCLGKLDKLIGLRLANLPVTDEWLEVIASLPLLEHLDLSFSRQSAVAGGSEDSGGNPRATRRGLSHLRQLTKLKDLDLSYNMAVTDEWSPFLSTLRLEELMLRRTRITSASLSHLARLESLWWLDLSDNPGITDEGLEHFVALRALQHLELQDTRVTAHCLPYVSRLEKLTWLDLSREEALPDEAVDELDGLREPGRLNLGQTRLTSKSLVNIKRLTKLRFLNLSGRRGVDDEGARCLANLSSLEHLYLQRTSVTTPGLEHLKRLKSLQLLRVSVTDAWDLHKTRSALTEMFPGCYVSVGLDDAGSARK